MPYQSEVWYEDLSSGSEGLDANEIALLHQPDLDMHGLFVSKAERKKMKGEKNHVDTKF